MSELNGAVVANEKVSGTQVILSILKEKGMDTPAKDVVDEAAKRGQTVTTSLVNNIKTRVRKAKKARKRRGVPAPVTVVDGAQAQAALSLVTQQPTTTSGDFASLLEAKALAVKLGGTSKVRELLDMLDKLS